MLAASMGTAAPIVMEKRVERTTGIEDKIFIAVVGLEVR
jgi:hypothetical protein